MATKTKPTGVEQPPTPNGDPLAGRVLVDARPSAPAPVPAGPGPRFRLRQGEPLPDGRVRAPRREVELAVPGYDGFTVWLWANYPQRIRLALTSSPGEEELRALLARLIVEHNGWSDSDGEPYPDATDPLFWDAIPQELGNVLVLLLLRDAPAAFPNSRAANGGS